MKASVPKQPLPAKAYVRFVLVGIVVLLVFVLIYSLLIPRLSEFGELHFFRYILLVGLGLIGAIILFGTMSSSADVNYKERSWAVKVSGPAAIFVLIVIGGIKFVPNAPQSFDVTIRPESSDTESAIIASGSIIIDLDSDRRIQPLSPNGEADFKQIPWKFRGKKVKVRPQVDGYEVKPQSVVLSESVVALPLVKLPPPVTVFRGSITLPKGKSRSVRVLVEGQEGEVATDAYGRFEIRVDGSPGDRVRVRVFIDGNLAYDDFQTLPGPVTLVPRLHR
jgi:hypothetical protein